MEITRVKAEEAQKVLETAAANVNIDALNDYIISTAATARIIYDYAILKGFTHKEAAANAIYSMGTITTMLDILEAMSGIVCGDSDIICETVLPIRKNEQGGI